jgi:hypothetical protein
VSDIASNFRFGLSACPAGFSLKFLDALSIWRKRWPGEGNTDGEGIQRKGAEPQRKGDFSWIAFANVVAEGGSGAGRNNPKRCVPPPSRTHRSPRREAWFGDEVWRYRIMIKSKIRIKNGRQGARRRR